MCDYLRRTDKRTARLDTKLEGTEGVCFYFNEFFWNDIELLITSSLRGPHVVSRLRADLIRQRFLAAYRVSNSRNFKNVLSLISICQKYL